MIEDKWVFILDIMLAGQCALVITQLVLSGLREPWRLPLILVFIGVFVSEVVSVLQTAWFPTLAINFVLIIPAHFLAIGGLWIYTAIITAPNPMHKRMPLYYHLWPAPISLLMVIPIFLLPPEARKPLALNGDFEEQYRDVVLLFVFTSVLWVIWAAPYLISIIRHLNRYRKRLRQIHSSVEHRSLAWLYVVVGLTSVFWLTSLFDVLAYVDIEVSIPYTFEVILDVLLVWTLVLWGIRQTPGLPDIEAKYGHDSDQTTPKNKQNTVSTKYQRSALSEKRVERIAQKITRAMETERLYQNPNLSLGMLANHLGITTNYISQTLNTKIGESFFEYINRWRALDAEKALRESSKTVMEISFDSGFNSRSAFYNAFNKRYGCAPAAYRKQHR